ncbi:hypothetical protein MJO28_004076 [Puccinia striiformis f. sp. tritici]|uniref:Uncharacterized protein n=1 Tax=Puccinia striiformis f. sp. tritici TaxID=168172 RepID=A0ACC0ENE6_9BASI|nr:hypothetical protein MJO28_004076 [Puccinia striiformis f. sp. tritici]KAI7963783.1 hypothetical protein MJO29_004210 [Puccinia striiformis f. sp. tritici]
MVIRGEEGVAMGSLATDPVCEHIYSASDKCLRNLWTTYWSQAKPWRLDQVHKPLSADPDDSND